MSMIIYLRYLIYFIFFFLICQYNCTVKSVVQLLKVDISSGGTIDFLSFYLLYESKPYHASGQLWDLMSFCVSFDR